MNKAQVITRTVASNLIGAGTGSLVGVYFANHNPLNIPGVDEQLIGAAISGTATYIGTKILIDSVVDQIFSVPEAIQAAKIKRAAKKASTASKP